MQKRLTKPFLRKWSKALKSGKYKQYQGGLVDVDVDNGEVLGHCCLGVAGCLLGIETDDMEDTGMPEDLHMDAKEVYPVELKAGASDIASTLANMNDSGKTFSEIGDYILSPEFEEKIKNFNNK